MVLLMSLEIGKFCSVETENIVIYKNREKTLNSYFRTLQPVGTELDLSGELWLMRWRIHSAG